MRVYVDANIKNPSTGKGYFAQRLAAAMSLQDCCIVDASQPHDFALHVIKVRQSTDACRIMRLNGVYHNTAQDYRKMNNAIKSNREKCHAVVYQSKFSKIMNEKYLGKFSGPDTIIFNGYNLNHIKLQDKSSLNHIHFVTSSRWRPHKRLADSIESFLLADIDNSYLHILGDIEKSGIPESLIRKYKRTKSIKFHGTVSQSKISHFLSKATAFLHLNKLDACPNGVVEAIAHKVPVICSNQGGTPELVEPSNGYVLPLDADYDFEPCDLYHPPPINRHLVAAALIKSVSESREVNREHIDIKNIAESYLSFFRKVKNVN